jgi:hypothetical protein
MIVNDCEVVGKIRLVSAKKESEVFGAFKDEV